MSSPSIVYRSGCWAIRAPVGRSAIARDIRCRIGGSEGEDAPWTGRYSRRLETNGRELEPLGVIRSDDELPVLDNLPIPGEDDEVFGLKRVEVGGVIAGLERHRASHLGRLQRANLAERQLHPAAG